MKETPPCLARAIASFSPETDCMMAETIGMFISSGQASSPLRYLTSGVFRLTAVGTHSEEESPGTSRYSPKVRDGSEK